MAATRNGNSRGSATAIALALLLGAAAPPAPVDWPALESAVAAYVTTPNEATAQGVTSLLPAAGGVALGEDPEELATRERIYRQLGKLEPLVLAGAPDAARVAFALRAISDGTFAELVDESLGASLAAHAEATLRALTDFPDVMGRGCRFASVLRPGATAIAAVAELDRRLEAVEAVSDATLRRPRACVALELGRAIDAY